MCSIFGAFNSADDDVMTLCRIMINKVIFIAILSILYQIYIYLMFVLLLIVMYIFYF